MSKVYFHLKIFRIEQSGLRHICSDFLQTIMTTKLCAFVLGQTYDVVCSMFSDDDDDKDAGLLMIMMPLRWRRCTSVKLLWNFESIVRRMVVRYEIHIAWYLARRLSVEKRPMMDRSELNDWIRHAVLWGGGEIHVKRWWPKEMRQGRTLTLTHAFSQIRIYIHICDIFVSPVVYTESSKWMLLACSWIIPDDSVKGDLDAWCECSQGGAHVFHVRTSN